MNTDQSMNPLVKAAIEAMSAHNRQAWLALFTSDAALTDDGSPRDFIQWSDSELFGKDHGHLLSIDRVEDHGLTIYGKFHSDRWGEFDTFMKFKVDAGKITRLDVGQVNE